MSVSIRVQRHRPVARDRRGAGGFPMCPRLVREHEDQSALFAIRHRTRTFAVQDCPDHQGVGLLCGMPRRDLGRRGRAIGTPCLATACMLGSLGGATEGRSSNQSATRRFCDTGRRRPGANRMVESATSQYTRVNVPDGPRTRKGTSEPPDLSAATTACCACDDMVFIHRVYSSPGAVECDQSASRGGHRIHCVDSQ